MPSPLALWLAKHCRLAILARQRRQVYALKRLAGAFSDPARRDESPTIFPSDRASSLLSLSKLRDLLGFIWLAAYRAFSREPVRQYSGAFLALVDRALLDGMSFSFDGLDDLRLRRPGPPSSP